MSHPNNPTARLFGAIFIFVMFVSLACNSPLSGSNADAVSTSAAQTVTAEFSNLTETAKAAPSNTPSPSPTTPSLPPSEAVPPSSEVISTEPPSPPETAIPVPTNPTIVASVDTNCRQGPAPEYPRTGFLLKGQQSNVVGRNDTNTWWYIEDPKKPGEYCWVWGQTTQVTGETASLQVITPPPPPALNADFTAFFAGINFCGGNPAAIFGIQNTGGAEFVSLQLTIQDFDLGGFVHQSNQNLPFFNSQGGCPQGNRTLAPGDLKYVGGILDNSVNTGDDASARIVLCTATGDCVQTVINFRIQ
jgi:hypothetical protein